MKFGKVGTIGKVTLVIAIALAVTTAFTACGGFTAGFLFVAINRQTPGQIEVYKVNSVTGVLQQIPTSPFPSGGRDPISEAVSPNFQNLYVANEDDNDIVQFAIGTDGKLYPQSTVNTPGSFPLAIAINTAGTYLYVVDTLGPVAGCSLANPCPGAIAVFPIDPKTGALGSAVGNNEQYPNYWPLQLTSADATDVLTPTALNVTADGNTVFVSSYQSVSSLTAVTDTGYLFAFTANSDGTLTELNGNAAICLNPGHAGCQPSQPVALTSDSGSSVLFALDKLNNLVDSVSVANLNVTGAAATGNQPSALTLYNGGFLYVTNSLDGSVTAYSVSGGNLSQIATYSSGVDPIAVTVDPRQVGFLYSVNFLGPNISGYKIDPTKGTLINSQQSPYVSSIQPVAIAGVPHGGTSK